MPSLGGACEIHSLRSDGNNLHSSEDFCNLFWSSEDFCRHAFTCFYVFSKCNYSKAEFSVYIV
jgi:hypothetical protein